MIKSKLVVTVALTLIAGFVLTRSDSDVKGIPDRDLGLGQSSVFEVSSPDLVAGNDSAPGEHAPIARFQPEAPPLVPHGVTDWLPITLDSNSCIDCHQVDVKEEGEPTPIPPSHFIDLRRQPDQMGDSVVGSRWNCIACHVSVSDAPLLVENEFEIPGDP